MKRILILVIIVSGLSFVANGQRVRKGFNYYFEPGWYVGPHAGVNWFMAEGIQNYVLDRSVGIAAGGMLGYNFTPVLGLRGTFKYARHHWPDTKPGSGNRADFVYKFGAQAVTGDVVINLMNLMQNYNYTHISDLYVFAGAGIERREQGDFTSGKTTPLAHGGLQLDVRVGPRTNINLIAEGNILAGDDYNDYVISFPFDMYTSFMVGITHHFPHTPQRKFRVRK